MKQTKFLIIYIFFIIINSSAKTYDSNGNIFSYLYSLIKNNSSINKNKDYALEQQSSNISNSHKELIDIAFSPYENPQSLIIKVIRSAKFRICMATYSFTLMEIAKELVKAKNRGVKVEVVSDYKESKSRKSVFNYLINNNIDARTNSYYKIMHNKFIVIDSETVETGSFNYSYSAIKNNAENVVVIWNNHQVAKVYENECNRLFGEGDRS